MANKKAINSLTREEALDWLIRKDPEATEFWKSQTCGVDELIKAIRDNIRDFGPDEEIIMANEQTHVSASHWGMHEYTKKLTQPIPSSWQKLANIQSVLEAVLLSMDSSSELYMPVQAALTDSAELVQEIVYNSSSAG